MHQFSPFVLHLHLLLGVAIFKEGIDMRQGVECDLVRINFRHDRASARHCFDLASEFLDAARAESSLPVVTEVMDTRQVELVARCADMLQVGARNMQNFSLLEAVGRCGRPVLLKRGLSETVTELLLAAEPVMAAGNRQISLCDA